VTDTERFDEVRSTILGGDAPGAAAVGEKLISTGADLIAAVEVAAAVIREVGDRFGEGELFLPEMVVAAEAMQSFMGVVTPHLEPDDSTGSSIDRGTVVIGTVQGDIHSIGKNIVATMLSASGYHVVDMGVSVSPMEAITAAEKAGASIIGLSALMTTSMPYQREVIDLLDALKRRKDHLVIVGGGPVTRDYAHDIGADGWAGDAATAVQICDRLVAKDTEPGEGQLIYPGSEG